MPVMPSPQTLPAPKKHGRHDLTAKQERFCRQMAAGASANDAFRLAYNVANMTDKSIGECASKLKRNAKCVSRIGALRAPSARSAQISIDRTLQHLTETAYATIRKAATRQEKLRGLELLMKHQGLFELDNLQKKDNIAIQINLVD
jgi:hypothetical protein